MIEFKAAPKTYKSVPKCISKKRYINDVTQFSNILLKIARLIELISVYVYLNI